MGDVLLKYRLSPDEGVDPLSLETELRKAIPASLGKVSKADVQPFVFGMKVLVASLIIQDVEGNNDKVEEILGKLPGCQGAELLDMGRLM